MGYSASSRGPCQRPAGCYEEGPALPKERDNSTQENRYLGQDREGVEDDGGDQKERPGPNLLYRHLDDLLPRGSARGQAAPIHRRVGFGQAGQVNLGMLQSSWWRLRCEVLYSSRVPGSRCQWTRPGRERSETSRAARAFPLRPFSRRCKPPGSMQPGRGQSLFAYRTYVGKAGQGRSARGKVVRW